MSSKKKGKAVARKSLKFVNDEAKQRFEMLKSTPMIFERGFEIEKRAWSSSYASQIHAMQWEILCHHRTEAILPWVYEFYLNARFSENDVVLVRGKMISFSARSINDMYELGNAEDFDNLDCRVASEVAALVCNSPDPEWSTKSKNALMSTSLSREAKVWLLFINASIMPTRHLNNVTLDRATLIYHIIKGNKFNVGEIISSQLKLKIQENKVRQLWFPVLITELCRSVGVGQGSEDLVTHVGRPITKRVVEKNIKVYDEIGTGSGKRRRRKMGDDPSSSSGKLEDVFCGTGDGASLFHILTNIEYLKSFHHCQHCYIRSRLDRMERKIDNLQKKTKPPVEEDPIEFECQFDDKGALLDGGGNSLDPTIYVDSEQDEEGAKDKEDDSHED